MKSYINSLFDYKKAPFEREVVITCPEEHLQTHLKRLTRSGKKNIAADVIENGDVVVLSLESALEKFNKPTVFITVGSHLFDVDFEEKLIDRKAGESFEIFQDGVPVRVTVKSITRAVYPDPTDEAVKAYAEGKEELNGIATVEEYKKYIVNQYIAENKSNAVYSAMDEIINYVLTHSDWEFDDGEIAAIVEEDNKYIDEELAEEGKTLETLTQTELQAFFGIDSADEIEKIMVSTAEQRIATVLWIAAVKGIDLSQMAVEGFEDYNFDFLEAFVRENLKIKEEK